MVEDAPKSDLPITKRSRWFWLRIAVSVFFGLLTLLLCVLWLRSYRHLDYVRRTDDLHRVWTSSNGYLHFHKGRTKRPAPVELWGMGTMEGVGQVPRSVYMWEQNARIGITVPYWFAIGLVSVATCIAALPWKSCVPTRFSLRTMLAITTLVAVMLGLVAWLVR